MAYHDSFSMGSNPSPSAATEQGLGQCSGGVRRPPTRWAQGLISWSYINPGWWFQPISKILLKLGVKMKNI